MNMKPLPEITNVNILGSQSIEHMKLLMKLKTDSAFIALEKLNNLNDTNNTRDRR